MSPTGGSAAAAVKLTEAQLARLMGDYTTVRWPMTKIRRYTSNPRRNSKAVPKVRASLVAFGWQQPIVVDPGGIIVVGDTRYLAALSLKLKSAPVHLATDLTPEEIEAYRVMDNRSAEEAEWDYGRLMLITAGLQALDYDLSLTGFDPPELAQLPDMAAEQRLSDMAGTDTPEDGGAPRERTATGLVNLGIPMTPQQRTEILAAVSYAKNRLGAGTLSAAALHHICTDWRRGQ
jgi:hypothetical protein